MGSIEREGTVVGIDSLGMMYLYQIVVTLFNPGLKRGRKHGCVPLCRCMP